MIEISVLSHVLLWIVCLAQGLLLLFLYRQFGLLFLGSSQGVNRDGLGIGSLARDVALLEVASQRQVTLSELRQGCQLVVFVGPRCPTCVKLFPFLLEFEGGQDDVEIVLISNADSSGTQMLRNDHGLGTLSTFADPEGELFNTFQVRVTPFAFLLDRDGSIRSKGLINGLGHIQRLMTLAVEAGLDRRVVTQALEFIKSVGKGPMIGDTIVEV